VQAIDIPAGSRGGGGCGAVMCASGWLPCPPRVLAALPANLACFCDLGGPIRPRLATLLSFSLLGAVMWGAFGLLGGAGLVVALPLAALAFFCNAFVRVWGLSAQTVGNLLSV